MVSEVTVGADGVQLVYAQPHMHLRGKDYELRAIYPTGETETLFKGKFDFDWQLGYDFAKPIPLPKGTRLIGISHFDNSVEQHVQSRSRERGPLGPAELGRDEQLFVGLIIDVKTDPEKVFKTSGPSLLPRGTFGPTLAVLEVK